MIVGKILPNNSNTNFTARLTPESKRQMSEILMPFVNSYTPISDIAKQTSYSIDNINRWSIKKFGMTLTQLYKKRINEELKKDFTDNRNSKTILKDMAQKYGHSDKWIRSRYYELGMRNKIKKERKMLLSENVPRMLDEGCTLKMMEEKLNIPKVTILGWIIRNLGCTIREYRNVNNIHTRYK